MSESPANSTTAVRTTPNNTSRTSPALNTFSASSRFFSPKKMLASGAPPMPTRLLNALTMRVMGNTTPSPASASVPMPAMLPTYMRSTRLYSKLMTCATTAGTASFATSLPTGAVPRSIAPCFAFISRPALTIFSLLYHRSGRMSKRSCRPRLPNLAAAPRPAAALRTEPGRSSCPALFFGYSVAHDRLSERINLFTERAFCPF